MIYTESRENKVKTDHSHTIRSVSFGTLWRILRIPALVLSALFLPPLMGKTVYGQFAVFLSFYFILDVLTDVGITQIFGRFLPQLEKDDPEKISSLLHRLMVYGMLLTISAIVFILVPLLMIKKAGLNTTWFAILSILLILAKLEGTLFSFIYGRNLIGRFFAKPLIRCTGSFVFVLIFFLLFGIDGALWGLVATEVLLLIMALVWTHKELFRKAKSSISFAELKPYLIFGFTFYIPMLLFSLIQRSGNIFTKMITGSDGSVTYYDLANQFTLFLGSFLGMIFTSMLPALTSLHINKEDHTIDKWHHTIMTYCGVITFMAFNALATLAKPFILLWYKEPFLPVYTNALILAAAMPAILIIYAGMNYALLHKEPKTYTKAVLVGLIVMAVSCFFLIPRMELTGTSIATVLGYSAAALIFLFKYWNNFKNILSTFLKTILAGLLITPLYYFNPAPNSYWVIFMFCVTTIIYIALITLFKLVRFSDAGKVWKSMQNSTGKQ